MITKNDLLLKLKELKPTLHKEYTSKKIGLLGSFSEETFKIETDIDILVELERPIGWKYFSLNYTLKRSLMEK